MSVVRQGGLSDVSVHENVAERVCRRYEHFRVCMCMIVCAMAAGAVAVGAVAVGL